MVLENNINYEDYIQNYLEKLDLKNKVKETNSELKQTNEKCLETLLYVKDK